MMTESILYPPLPPPQLRSQHFQKKCASCTCSHKQCNFESPQDRQCMRCCKMHLMCFFHSFWWVNQFCFTLPPSILLTFFPSVLSFSPEQGHWMTSPRSHVKLPPPTLRTHPIRDGLRLDDFPLTSGISDSVHYPPLIHSRVLRGSSCHTVL
jgi:hypothetical protein